MRRTVGICPLGIALGLTLLAGGADAQPSGVGDNAADAPSLVGPPPTDASKATSLKAGPIPAPDGPTPSRPTSVAPDVTVTGRRDKPCSNRDQACIKAISAEIWRRYPQQIQTMCEHQRVYAMQQGFVQDQLGIDGVKNDHLTPQTEALCDYGRRMKAQQAARASSAEVRPAVGASDKP